MDVETLIMMVMMMTYCSLLEFWVCILGGIPPKPRGRDSGVLESLDTRGWGVVGDVLD